MDAIVSTPLGNRIDQLSKRYDIDWITQVSRDQITTPTMDGDYNRIQMAKNLAQHLGYHYKNLDADPDTYLRFISESVRLGPDAGNHFSFNFVQYLINGYMGFEQMWYDPVTDSLLTYDDPSIAGRHIVYDGETDAQDCYPTSYIKVYVEQSMDIDTRALLALIYSVIPENYNIHSLETVYVSDVIKNPDAINGIVVEQYQWKEAAVLIDPDTGEYLTDPDTGQILIDY
jgi:hypothetical protein